MDPNERNNYRLYTGYEKKKAEEVGRGKERKRGDTYYRKPSLPDSGNSMCKGSKEKLRLEGL